jgi:hypothetical protein
MINKKKALCSIAFTFTLIMLTPTVSKARNLTIVYVTDTGKKYHSYNCSYLHSKREITLVDAIMLNYEPCSRCNPPEISDDDFQELLEILEIKESLKKKATYKETVSEAKEKYAEQKEQIKQLEQENKRLKDKNDSDSFWSFIWGSAISCGAAFLLQKNKN